MKQMLEKLTVGEKITVTTKTGVNVYGILKEIDTENGILYVESEKGNNGKVRKSLVRFDGIDLVWQWS